MKSIAIGQSPILQKYMLKYLGVRAMMYVTYLKWFRKKIGIYYVCVWRERINDKAKGIK